MSFTGDLEHLSIVDLIQLLHTTRKSGTLSVKGRKGESQLVFADGYIVSANHCDNSIRIGKLLVEAGAISQAILDQALESQKKAGDNRKPLISTLIEGGHIDKKSAFKGLELLIEMTVVEILTWKKGAFALDVDRLTIADDYRYFPEKLQEEIILNTQNVLMDALRIYDEKMRDGELFMEQDEAESEAEGVSMDDGFNLSADDLGLADLDQLDRKMPEMFSTLEDRDPVKIHREALEALPTGLAENELEELVNFLAKFSPHSRHDGGKPGATRGSLILFSSDEVLRYAVTAVCKQEGILVFTSNDEPDLDPIIDQFLSKNVAPILVIDTPQQCGEGFSEDSLMSLRQQKKKRYPGTCIIQFTSRHDTKLPLQAYLDGARAVIPRPVRDDGDKEFPSAFTRFLDAFATYVQTYAAEVDTAALEMVVRALPPLRGLREARDVALSLLQFTASIFARSVTLIVGEHELVAEKGIGVKAEKDWGVPPEMNFRVPLDKPSLLTRVIEEGTLFFGKTDDGVVKESIHGAIGSPLHAGILLLPLKCYGKTICVTYADFGKHGPTPVQTAALEVYAAHAGLVLENVLYRKSFGKTSR